MNTTGAQQLGAINKPVLIFGGCYSNLQATQVLKTWSEENGFSPEHCICTGDIVAYCGNPVETVELIREWGVHCIRGNVEQSLSVKADDCGCGFEENTVCDILSRGWYSYADNAVSAQHRTWFSVLPRYLHFSMGTQKVHVVHGAVSDVSRFMFLSQDDNDFHDEFNLLAQQQGACDVIIAGHSGLPFTKHLSLIKDNQATYQRKTWHNSGALGMPANDGTRSVWFSVVDQYDGGLRFTHHRLSYDVVSAVEQMVVKGLTQGYHEALQTGLWPSMDVLPVREQQQQGQTIVF